MSSPKRNMKSLGLVLVRLAPYASKPPKARPLARDMTLPGEEERGGEGRGREGRGGEGRGGEGRGLLAPQANSKSKYIYPHTILSGCNFQPQPLRAHVLRGFSIKG